MIFIFSFATVVMSAFVVHQQTGGAGLSAEVFIPAYAAALFVTSWILANVMSAGVWSLRMILKSLLVLTAGIRLIFRATAAVLFGGIALVFHSFKFAAWSVGALLTGIAKTVRFVFWTTPSFVVRGFVRLAARVQIAEKVWSYLLRENISLRFQNRRLRHEVANLNQEVKASVDLWMQKARTAVPAFVEEDDFRSVSLFSETIARPELIEEKALSPVANEQNQSSSL